MMMVRVPLNRAATWGSLNDDDDDTRGLDPEKAKRHLLDLKEKLRTTRREDVAKHVIPLAKTLDEEAAKHHHRCQLALEEAHNEYKRKHFWPFLRFASFMGDPKKFRKGIIEPLKMQLVAAKELHSASEDLRRAAESEGLPVEIREARSGSNMGVYNPLNGKVSWKMKAGSVAGTFNRSRHTVQWRCAMSGCVAACWDEENMDVIWKSTRVGSVYGVYNPIAKNVEWKSYKHGGLSGVWNPKTEHVEWRCCDAGCAAGYFDHNAGSVVWIERHNVSSLCVVYWDPVAKTYKSSCCYVSGIEPIGSVWYSAGVPARRVSQSERCRRLSSTSARDGTRSVPPAATRGTSRSTGRRMTEGSVLSMRRRSSLIPPPSEGEV